MSEFILIPCSLVIICIDRLCAKVYFHSDKSAKTYKMLKFCKQIALYMPLFSHNKYSDYCPHQFKYIDIILLISLIK